MNTGISAVHIRANYTKTTVFKWIIHEMNISCFYPIHLIYARGGWHYIFINSVSNLNTIHQVYYIALRLCTRENINIVSLAMYMCICTCFDDNNIFFYNTCTCTSNLTEYLCIWNVCYHLQVQHLCHSLQSDYFGRSQEMVQTTDHNQTISAINLNFTCNITCTVQHHYTALLCDSYNDYSLS